MAKSYHQGATQEPEPTNVLALIGCVAATLAWIGFIILAKTAAWNAIGAFQKFVLIVSLVVSACTVLSTIIHSARDGFIDGIFAGTLLLLLGSYPLCRAAYYLFIGPKGGGLIGGVGAGIAFAQFCISGLVVLSGIGILSQSLMKRSREKTITQPDPASSGGPLKH